MYSGKSPPTMFFQTAVVGTRGLKFPMFQSGNAVNRITGLRPNPNLGQPNYVDNSQTVTYYGWQNSLRKRFSRSFSFDVNYTWSKALSNGGGDTGAYYDGENSSRNQEFFDLKADRGPTASDITHYYSALTGCTNCRRSPAKTRFCAMLPATGNSREVSLLKPASPSSSPRVLRRRVSAATISAGRRSCPTTRDTLRYLDPAAFREYPFRAAVHSIRAGNYSPGALRAPGLWNLNFSLAKNFKIHRKGEIADPHRHVQCPQPYESFPDCERVSTTRYSASF